MHLHILGICGTFMAGVAAIAREAGYRVTGCDANVYPPMSTQLQAMGIAITEGWGAEQLECNADVYVVGNVVSRGNPLMEAILARQLPYVSGPEWLREHVLRGRWVLAVAGTHGKTTTSSLLAWLLEEAGMQPGFLIGGVPGNFGVSARLGRPGGCFVVEADEYDTAFFDKRSKFVHYRPRTVILNNLEFDHADIFPDLAAIETQFHHLLRTVPGNGLVVANAQDAAIARVLERGCWTPLERFGAPEGWHERDLDARRFEVWLGDALQGTADWDLQGEHNRMNALAAVAAARHAGVPAARSIAALSSFCNVRRRMELRGVEAGVAVYDDFAHHPTAIRLTVAGLRRRVGAARILAVLEPRSNTMKLGTWKDELAPSLIDADAVFCYTAGIGWDAAEALAPLGARLRLGDDIDELAGMVAESSRPGDHVLVMSNGGFGGIHEKLLATLRGRADVARPAGARQ